MKFPLPARLSLLAALGAWSFAAMAQPVDPAAAQDPALTATTAAAPMDERADRRCLKSTGSRVTADHNSVSDDAKEQAGADPKCAIGNGVAYTREDIDRTGRTTVAEALKALDPSLR